MIGFTTVCVSSWRELMSALLLKADMCSATRNVRFVPIADIRDDLRKQKDHLAAVSPNAIRCN